MRFRTLLIIMILLPSVSIIYSCSHGAAWEIEIWNESSVSVSCECGGFVNDCGGPIVSAWVRPFRAYGCIASFEEPREYIKHTNIQDYITTDSAFVNLYKINENGDTCLVKRWTYLDDKDQGYSPFNLDTLHYSVCSDVAGTIEYVWRFNITDEMLEQDTISRAQAR